MKINIYTMLKTLLFTIQNGKNLSSGLKLLADTANTKQEKKIYININNDLKDGKTFSEALQKHKIGSSDVIQFVTMAEQGVNFKVALEKIIRYLETKDQFQRESSDQTSLPVIYFSISSLVVLGVKFYAVPMQLERSMEYSPEIINLISGHLHLAELLTNILFFILIIVASYFFTLMIALFSQSRTIQSISKQIALALPFSSKIVMKFEKFILFSMLGDMLQSGITFKRAINSAIKTTTISKFRNAMQITLDSIKYDGKFIFHSYLYDSVEKGLLAGVGSSKQIGSVMIEISSRAKTDAMYLSSKFFRMITLTSIFMMAFAVFIEFYTVVLTQILIQKGLIDASKGVVNFG